MPGSGSCVYDAQQSTQWTVAAAVLTQRLAASEAAEHKTHNSNGWVIVGLCLVAWGCKSSTWWWYVRELWEVVIILHGVLQLRRIIASALRAEMKERDHAALAGMCGI